MPRLSNSQRSFLREIPSFRLRLSLETAYPDA
jgi:hypothetical protein